MLLSGKWGPYNVIGQCLDRVKRIKTGTLQRFPEYELENSQCRTEPGQTFGTREYPNSSDGAQILSLTEIYEVTAKHLYEYLWVENLSGKIQSR